MKKLAIGILAFAFLILGIVADSTAQQNKTPQKGGILKMIAATSPQVLGYFPEMGPNDGVASYPAIEWIMEFSTKRELVPFLAESVKVDEKKLTITYKLRKGIKFHDGSELTSDVVLWNIKNSQDCKRMPYADKITKIDVVDKYTYVFHLSEYHNQMLFAYNVPAHSKQAFETKGKEWVRLHPVGTGPFKLVEFKRDSHCKWERNKEYWQKGYPLLDGIEVRYIPDPVTASSLMQAKEADIWIGASVKDQADLSKKGFIRQTGWSGAPSMLYMNIVNPKAPTSNIKIREAIEYAIDRPAMAKALGFGLYEPLKMTAPQSEWGFDPAFKGRPYDPDKAKKLLTEAGYNGTKMKILALSEGAGRNSVAETIKQYLDQVGINVEVDIADPGRFYGSLWANGWDDMALFLTGLDYNYLATFQAWFGHQPRGKLASYEPTPEMVTASKQSIKYMKVADQKEAARKLTRMISDEALVIPLVYSPSAVIAQPWAHTTFYLNGVMRWTCFADWLEKR
jgi:peptide/nickel transport system substrate-binding protein